MKLAQLTFQFSSIAVVLLVGCRTSPLADASQDSSQAHSRIQRRLDEILDAAEKKDFVRLDSYHLYGLMFTKFTTGTTGRLDADAARKGEHDGLSAATGLTMRANDVKIDVFGDVGIATFMLDYSFKAGADTVSKKANSTLVLVRDQGDWRIVHEHLSTPPPPEAR